MARNAGCLTDGEPIYEASSRTESKRGHQWFTWPSELELFHNKRQAVEGVNDGYLSGNPNMSFPLGENTSSFQPPTGQFIDSLFGPDPVMTSNNAGRNITPVGDENLIREVKFFEDCVGNPSFVNLSMSYAREYPSSFLDHGEKKVKVNQVRDSQSDISVPVEYSLSGGNNQSISLNSHHNETDNSISVGQSSDDGIGPTFRSVDGNSVSNGQDFTLMRHDYNKGYKILSMGQPFNNGDENYVVRDEVCESGDHHIMSMGHTYNENFTSMKTSYNKADENLIPMVHTFDNVEGTTISIGVQGDRQAYSCSGRMISSYDLLINQAASENGRNHSVEGNADKNLSAAPVATSKPVTLSKKKGQKKETKKMSSNSFPTNVKSLLSTGILDGVPVKYVSWSRDKKLRGIIKGTGYLCGCQECNLSNPLNAYEFERHAGCKTKHPNNHIYFENGKTIYAVVQELRSTPQNLLLEVITKVTGSPINQPNFDIWKASYLAATRELTRIYGNGEAVIPS